MDPISAPLNRREVVQEEVPFPFEELFFSRTDERGIILSGNSVFQRISQYPWEELLRKPHNLIRHPDMPKAVFWLLWDCIKKGEPIGAYVKNRAKDGRYYWVFAIVTPIDGGYLSVRLKPSSPLLPIVEQEYAALLAVETGKSLKPPESAALLLGRLSELGFPDYSSFMSTALAQEITERDAKLNRKSDYSIRLFSELVTSAKSLMKHAGTIFRAYSLNEFVPLNLRVQAAQLKGSGATIDVISNNYNIISGEIKAGMDHFTSSAKEVTKAIDAGLFLIGTSRIQSEVLDFFHSEPPNEGASREEEIDHLTRQQSAYHRKAIEGLRSIGTQVQKFRQSCFEMKRLAAGLEVTRIMGKVESARLTVSSDGLKELINELETFQIAIADGLKEIDRMNQTIQFNITQLLGSSTEMKRA